MASRPKLTSHSPTIYRSLVAAATSPSSLATATVVTAGATLANKLRVDATGKAPTPMYIYMYVVRVRIGVRASREPSPVPEPEPSP